MKEVEYVEGGQELLGRIADLYDQLSEVHIRCSPEFKTYYERLSFENKKKYYLEKTRDGRLLVILARDKASGKDIGFCVSTITRDRDGYIESIFVEKHFRMQGIGDEFMKRALKWFERNNARALFLGVAWGNEGVFPFYAKYGFKPRVAVLERPPK